MILPSRVFTRTSLFLVIVLASLGAASTKAPPAFKDITADTGIKFDHRTDLTSGKIFATMGAGAAFCDYDLDGNLDLVLVNSVAKFEKRDNTGNCTALYRGDGRGHFTDVTARAGLTACGWGMGASWADLDNDGWPDLYVTEAGGNSLYRNNGDGTFANVTARAGVAVGRWSATSNFLDYDHDGDVDLYVACYLQTTPERENEETLAQIKTPEDYPGQDSVLFRNNGDGTFTDVTAKANAANHDGKSLGVACFDFNGDGWTDIYVANDRVRGALLKNNGDGTFKEVALSVGTAYNADGKPTSGMGVTVGDYDRDGDPDIFMTNFADETNTLYRNLKNKLYEDVTVSSGTGPSSLDYVGWGTNFFDYDNDGWLDLYVNNGNLMPMWVVKSAMLFKKKARKYDVGKGFEQPPLLYRNLGGKFQQVVAPAAGDFGKKKLVGRGSAVGDIDNDGDLDVVLLSQGSRTTVYRNEIGNRLHWIDITLVGDRARTPLGAKLTLTAGGATQTAELTVQPSYGSGSWTPLHFGLGTAARIDKLEILWPEGTRDAIADLAVDRSIAIGRGGTVHKMPVRPALAPR